MFPVDGFKILGSIAWAVSNLRPLRVAISPTTIFKHWKLKIMMTTATRPSRRTFNNIKHLEHTVWYILSRRLRDLQGETSFHTWKCYEGRKFSFPCLFGYRPWPSWLNFNPGFSFLFRNIFTDTVIGHSCINSSTKITEFASKLSCLTSSFPTWSLTSFEQPIP